MDILRIDPITYMALDVVEGFTSKIWTDRYLEFSEFEFHSPNIDETMAALPEGSFVGIRGDKQVMRVENHEISTNDDGVEEVVTTGRAWETIFERRFFVGDYQAPWPMQQLYTAQNAAMVAMYNCILNYSGDDVTMTGSVPKTIFDYVGANVLIHDATRIVRGTNPDGNPNDLQSTKEWYLQSGEAWKQIYDILNVGELGIRTVRPTSPIVDKFGVNGDGTIIAPDPPFTSSTGNELRVEIYNGRIRTSTPSTEDPLPLLTFSTKMGHIAQPKYLFSVKEYRNLCHVSSSYGELEVTSDDVGFSDPFGINRHAMWVDAGTIDDTVLTPEDYLTQVGKAALKSANRKRALDGSISPNSPYVYGRDYFLGDRVTMVGNYGFTADMQVAEYVRSEDKTGEKGYPTLIHVE